jgi:hypothetical protein
MHYAKRTRGLSPLRGDRRNTALGRPRSSRSVRHPDTLFRRSSHPPSTGSAPEIPHTFNTVTGGALPHCPSPVGDSGCRLSSGAPSRRTSRPCIVHAVESRRDAPPTTPSGTNCCVLGAVLFGCRVAHLREYAGLAAGISRYFRPTAQMTLPGGSVSCIFKAQDS